MSRLSLTLFRAGMSTLGTLAPDAGARAARRLFLRPRRFPPKPFEAELPEPHETIMLAGGLCARRWGAGERIVLLIHGWEGRHTQFAHLIPELTARGLTAVTVDPPAHGSSGGTTAHPVAFAEALRAAADHFGPAHALIGHSMGAGAALYALDRGLTASRVILIAPPIGVTPILQGFARFVGLPARARRRFITRIEAHVGVPAEALDCERLATGRAEPALIVHDADDKEMPVAWAQAISAAWPGAELLETHGLGHRRILADDGVCARVADFAVDEAFTIAADTAGGR